MFANSTKQQDGDSRNQRLSNKVRLWLEEASMMLNIGKLDTLNVIYRTNAKKNQ